MTQRLEGRVRRRRPVGDPALKSEAGRVFSPADGREQDFSLDLEVAMYRARKGQAGNRGHGKGGPHPYGCRCSVCVYNTSFRDDGGKVATSRA